MSGLCGWMPTQGTFWWSTAYVPPLLVISASAFAWTLRLGFVALRTIRELKRLPRAPFPPNLVRTAKAVGLDRIDCVAGGSLVAFCAGIVRPSVFISEAAAAGLSDSELMAVLHHEADHARRYEPLRRMARTAAADVLAFLPIVGWWSERQIARSELSADAAAERMAGRSALAGALLVMTAPAIPLAAFVGHAELRAQRLLGMRIDEPGPPRGMWAATFVYSGLALSLAACLFEVVLALRR
ncbi:hypothetical protein EPN29_04670 [bacterium]|nr:MAG: hypothetical protein EPN29_04670 [bacterium]